jgi:hypothetical protein
MNCRVCKRAWKPGDRHRHDSQWMEDVALAGGVWGSFIGFCGAQDCYGCLPTEYECPDFYQKWCYDHIGPKFWAAHPWEEILRQQRLTK